MTDPKTTDGEETRVFRWPAVTQLVIELGYIKAEESRVRDIAGQLFKAQNPDIAFKKERAALDRHAREAAARRKKLAKDHRRTDAVHTITSAERVCKPHWVTRMAGGLAGLLGIGLAVPLVLVVGAGIEESLLIERVVDLPMWALAYGIAPLGGIAASHGLREAVKSDCGRRWLDLGIYGSAIAAFGLWAWQFGPTFLADTLANPGAAAQRGSALSDFYGTHLALEFFGGAATFCAATHMLTTGARLIAIRSETAQILEDTMASEAGIELALANRQDTVAAAPTVYEDAMRAFQDHCVVRVEVVKKLFEAESASDGLRLLAELRTKFLNTSEGDQGNV